MTELTDKHAQDVSGYKQEVVEYQLKVDDLDRSHVDELQEYEKRVREMSSNDEELQTHLRYTICILCAFPCQMDFSPHESCDTLHFKVR